jgi:hypothetical protein
MPTCTQGATPAFTGGISLDAPAELCPTCTCGLPTGGTCGTPTASLYDTQTCSNTGGCASASLTMGTCSQLTTTGANGCATVMQGLNLSVSATATGVTCPVTSLPPVKPPKPTWGLNVTACPLSTSLMPCSGGTGGVCANASTSSVKVCVLQTVVPGVAPVCPAPYTATTMTAYSSYDDQRGCSTCSCPPPTLVRCTGGSATFSPLDCSKVGFTTAVPLDCTMETATGLSQYYATLLTEPQPTGGSCLAPTVVSTGTATPTGATTFCCL